METKDKAIEEKTITEEESGGEVASENKTVNLIERMRVKREEVTPPTFLEDVQFLNGADSSTDEEEAEGEQLTDDDEANMDYLNYEDEHKTTATFLIMTFDRLMAFVSGLLAREREEAFRKFETKASISSDYLDVSAALVKKYQARMSLEFILVITVVTIYGPTLSIAYSKGKAKKAQEEAKKAV